MVSIQGFIKKFSPKKSGQKTRQQTLPAAFSRMDDRTAFKESSTPPSLTTASTATDRSSETGDDTRNSPIIPSTTMTTSKASKESEPLLELSTLQRSSLDDEDISVRVSPRRTKGSKPSTPRSVQSQSKVESRLQKPASSSLSTPEAQGAPQHGSFDSLGADWDLGASPSSQSSKPHPRGSALEETPARAHMAGKASQAIAKTRSVLGKRRRTTSDSASPGSRALKSPRRGNLRERSGNGAVKRESEPKTNSSRKLTIKSTTTRRKERISKVWLEHGIYVGQSRSSDPRFTQKTKTSKITKITSKTGDKPERQLLPLPMYMGERLIEYGRGFALPFDVFQPLPPGQPRPDEWKKTQKNVFVKEAKGGWPKSHKLDHSQCLCDPETGCGENCLNRDMWYECNESNCNTSPELCTNRPFAELKARLKKKKTNLASGKLIASAKYNTGVEVFKTADRGHGLRSCRTFRPNQVIVEYTGEIITREEANRRVINEYKDNACYYLMDFHHSTILDGSRGSIARFVNHSCAPNCRIEKWTVDGVPRMALFAGDKGVMTGDELTYDYNYAPYDQKNVTECRCGAAQCRGVLGPKPKDKDLKDALKPIAGGKRKFEDIIDGAVSGAKDLAASLNGKRRKVNLPNSAKALLVNGKLDKSPKRPLMKNGKPLPKGWVFPKVAFDFSKKINDEDPEAIIRRAKRKKSTSSVNSAQGKGTLATVREEEVGTSDWESVHSSSRKKSNAGTRNISPKKGVKKQRNADSRTTPNHSPSKKGVKKPKARTSPQKKRLSM